MWQNRIGPDGRKWRESHVDDVEPASELLERILNERRRSWEKAYLADRRAKGKLPKDEKWEKKYKHPKIKMQDDLFILPERWAWTTPEQLASSDDYSL